MPTGNQTQLFSARAECNRDMIELLRKPFWFKTLRWEPMFDHGADLLIEFEVNATIDELLAALRTITDTHVLRETLRPVPLSENSLERDSNVD